MTTSFIYRPHQVGIFHSKRGRGELGEVWREKVAGREGVEERMLQTGIIRFLQKSHLSSHLGLQLSFQDQLC